jgi:hypothetical protein
VARGPRPTHKSLGDPLARAPAAEELGEGRSSEAVGRNRRQEGEHSLVLAQVDVRHLLEEADMPAGGGAVVLFGLLVSEEERQLEGLG